MVKYAPSPDDPALAAYWANRRRRATPPPLDNLSLRLLQSQRGACPVCGELLLYADHPPQSPAEWEQWVRTTAKAVAKQHIACREHGASGERTVLRLIHAHCRPSPALATTGQLQRRRADGLA